MVNDQMVNKNDLRKGRFLSDAPFEAVFGVFYLEAERGEFVAYLVGGSPVFVLLRLQTDA